MIRATRILTITFMASLMLAMSLALTAFAPQAHAIATRATDVTAPAAGNCLLAVDGIFYSDGKAAVLAMVNKIRKEACNQGVPDPRDESRNLASDDYVPMRWSSDLEKIAQTRAAEGSICQSHTRPNGDSCFNAYIDDPVFMSGETLAWNYSASMLEGIQQWYEEKSDWVSQNANAMTGHYTIMIDPDNTHMGLGAFATGQGMACIAGEYLKASWHGSIPLPEDEIGVTGGRRQIVEVQNASIAGVKVVGGTTLAGAVKRTYSARVAAKLDSLWGGKQQVKLVPLGSVTWKSSTPATATVSANGQVASRRCGTTRLTATVSDMGKSGSVTLNVIPKNTKFKSLTAKKKALKVKWSAPASLATGYQIRYSLKKSMKKAKTVTVKRASKRSATIKKLKPKKKYYVQVRSFAKVGGKAYYSAWTVRKAKKTK